jgi:hypothetical protein
LPQVGHGEFVTDWPGSFSTDAAHGSISTSGTQASAGRSSSVQQQAALLQQLSPYCRDLAVVVMGEPPVNFVHKSKVSASSNSSRGAGSMLSRQDGRQLDSEVAAAGLRDNGGVPVEWN